MLQGTLRRAAMVLASVLVLGWTAAEARTQPVDLSPDSLFPFSMLVLPGDPFAHAQPLLGGHGTADPLGTGVHGRLHAPAADSTGRSPDPDGTGGAGTTSQSAAGWTGALEPVLPDPLSLLPPPRVLRTHAG